MKIKHHALAAIALSVASFAVLATDYKEEYQKKVKSEQNIGVLGENLAGDSVNFYSGATSFAATDISLPTNALALTLSRSYSVEYEHNLASAKGSVANGIPVVYSLRQRAFGNWDLDVPMISTTMTQSAGWIVDSTTPQNRCSVIGQVTSTGAAASGAPPAAVGTKGWTFDPGTYWNGYTLHMPGGDQSLLLASLTNPQRPSTGGPYHWTTNRDWWVSCLPTTANNAGGEGYLAISPDGTKYTFNWLSKRNVTTIEDSYETDPMGGGATRTSYVFRADYMMLPTRIEDRFGNWITYTWSSDSFARLLNMKSGAVGSSTPVQTITLAYNAQGYVATASDGTRTWTYVYASDYALSQVVLPDNSSWTYGFDWLEALMPPRPQCSVDPYSAEGYWLCFGGGEIIPQSPVSAHVIHPAGARVDFVFDHHFQYMGESMWPMGMTQKTISGPGQASATWKLDFLPRLDQIRDACRYATCPDYVMSDQAGPDGSLQRRIFQLAGGQGTLLQGELAGSLTANGGGSPAITTSPRWGTAKLSEPAPASGSVPSFYRESDYRYVPETQTVPYIVKVGVNPATSVPTPGMQVYATERRNPTQKRIVSQQVATFTAETTVFDAYGRPATVVKSSVGGAGGNFSKTDTTTYDNNLAKWVVGQVATTAVSGKVLSKTVYDASTALPWKVYGVDQTTPRQTLTYNVDGTVATVKDGLLHLTTLSNWDRGVPKQITFPDAKTMSAEVSTLGQITSATNQLGAKTCYGYDSAIGRLNAITYPSETVNGVCNETTWNKLARSFVRATDAAYGLPAGHWREIVQTGNGKVTSYYDGQWRPVLVLTEDTGTGSKSFVVKRYDGTGRQVFVSYPVGALTSVSDPLYGTTTEYDALGRAIKSKQDSELAGAQAVLETKTEYLSGLQTRVTNPRNSQTTTSFQAFDEPSLDSPLVIVMPEGVTVSIDRQPDLGKPLAITRAGTWGGSPLSATRRYVYDSNERLCKSINPESGATLVDYDNDDKIVWTADGTSLTTLTCNRASVTAAQKTTRAYDVMDRVTNVTTTLGTSNVSTTYYDDGLINTLTAANPGGNPVVTAYTFNKRRMLTAETSSNGGVVYPLYYGYSANGHLSTLEYPDEELVQYSPDALGRATQVAASAGPVYASNISYHPSGAIAAFTYGNGVVHTMTPNRRGLPATSRDMKGATKILDDSYVYDPNGNVDFITDAAGIGTNNRTRDLGYDNLDRLLVADAPNQWGTASYTYDPLDNLRTANLGTRQFRYNYDASNRLADIKNPAGALAYSFTYDVRGNSTAKNVGAGCASDATLQCAGKASQAYAFDLANRMSQVTGVQTYRYDGLGRRVQTTDADGKTTFWIYSQSGQVLHTSEARRSQNLSYIYLGNTQIATRAEAWTTGAVTLRYEHTDALGSPVVETDSSGVVAKRNSFTAWGEAWGPTAVDGTGYTGHVMDQATTLTYMQQRYYDPQIGRFISRDPAESEFNRYNYASNNPYRFVDPDGRYSILSYPEEAEAKYEREGLDEFETGERQRKDFNKAGAALGQWMPIVEEVVEEVDEQLTTPSNYAALPVGGGIARAGAAAAEKAGVVYLRRNPKTLDLYVGKAKSWVRYVKRQAEHNVKAGIKHEYQVLARASGRTLQYLEEVKIRELGGLSKLANQISAMSQKKFNDFQRLLEKLDD